MFFNKVTRKIMSFLPKGRRSFSAILTLIVISVLSMNFLLYRSEQFHFQTSTSGKYMPALEKINERSTTAWKRRGVYKLKRKANSNSEQDKMDSNSKLAQSSYTISKLSAGFEETATEMFVNRSEECPHYSLYTNQMNDVYYGTCRPHLPADAACKYAKELYYLDPGLKRCAEGDGNICNIEMKDKQQKLDSNSKFVVVCNRTLCWESESLKKHFMVVTLNPDTGETNSRQRFRTFKQFETALVDIIEKTVAHKLHFLFLRCKKRNGKIASQLMTVDPRIYMKKSENPRSKKVLNVNILLLDSVARAHFYRSLPETINTFKNWATNPRTAPAKIFDFELFQAVEGHTAENTHTLFTGKPLPSNMHSETAPVEMDVMFGHFKRSGYETMWQEDLCYKGIWGLMTDVGARDWTNLQTNLEDSYIDHTGNKLF